MRTFIALVLLFQASTIEGPSNWGEVKQDGKKVQLEGHPCWIANGEIRKDGKLFLLWVELATGRTAPSVYTISKAGIVGEWGWGTECEVLENGTLVGRLMSDRIVVEKK